MGDMSPNGGRCRFYLIIFFAYKKIQSSLQLLISTLKFFDSVVQNNFNRLFHTISSLQLLFLLHKFYFLLKNKISGQNIIRLSKSQNTTYT
jgi:hypothetical protein